MREDLLTPLAGNNPSGVDLRYDAKLPVYDKIREARRQDDELAQGDWQRPRKAADFALVAKLAQEALATRSKDLQLATWLTEALLHTESFAGLRQGLLLCHGLITNFWGTLYPPMEDGDLEARAGLLDWLGSTLEVPIKAVPLVRCGYDWFKYKESRLVGYEEYAQSDREKETRAARIAEGKLTPELFDGAFQATPKIFYNETETALDACLDAVKNLNDLCAERFSDQAPSFGKLTIALEEVRHTVHLLLEKKRESEPDPLPEIAVSSVTSSLEALGSSCEATQAAPSTIVITLANSEPPQRREAIANIAAAAALLRKLEPHSPAPYLMMRGLRWGELRTAVQLSDSMLLEGPPTELRRQIKLLALNHKWEELLNTAENAMSLPCSRAWLDLQRFVIEACEALRGPYEAVGFAIRSELKALLSDLPDLLDATLLDDTPAASAETRAWLNELLSSPEKSAQENEANTPTIGTSPNSRGGWMAGRSDAFAVAQQTLAAGRAEKAFEIMHNELARQRCGRGRFERTLQLIQLCVASGKNEIAQPLLEDLGAAIEMHKLEDWEERETVAEALATIMKVSTRVRGDAVERHKLFERICRLDPVRALDAGNNDAATAG
jgi:type VI secretion system protein ImpA